MKDRLTRIGLSVAVLLGGGAVGGTAVTHAQDRGVYLVEPEVCTEQVYLVPETALQLDSQGKDILEDIAKAGQFTKIEPHRDDEAYFYENSAWSPDKVDLAELMGKKDQAFFYPFPYNDREIEVGQYDVIEDRTLGFGYNNVNVKSTDGNIPLTTTFLIPCPDAEVYIRSESNSPVLTAFSVGIDEHGYLYQQLRILTEAVGEISHYVIVLPRNTTADQPSL